MNAWHSSAQIYKCTTNAAINGKKKDDDVDDDAKVSISFFAKVSKFMG